MDGVQQNWAPPVADDNVQLMHTVTPDPQNPKRRPWDRVTGRRGEFSVAEAKEAKRKQQGDGQ
jgi:hypothetical protein